MRRPKATLRALTLGVTLLLVAPWASSAAAGQTRLATAAGSEVWLHGETNLMSWQCHGEELTGGLTLATDRDQLEELLHRMEAPEGSSEELTQHAAALVARANLHPQMRLEIPVASLDCGRRAMERDMRRTLRADEFPRIVFELDSVREARLFPGSPGDPVRYRLLVRGDLELAGTRRPVELAVTGLRDGPDRFRFYTSLPLAMSDFGLTPPVALFGLLHASDDLTVAVTLVLAHP